MISIPNIFWFRTTIRLHVACSQLTLVASGAAPSEKMLTPLELRIINQYARLISKFRVVGVEYDCKAGFLHAGSPKRTLGTWVLILGAFLAIQGGYRLYTAPGSPVTLRIQLLLFGYAATVLLFQATFIYQRQELVDLFNLLMYLHRDEEVCAGKPASSTKALLYLHRGFLFTACCANIVLPAMEVVVNWQNPVKAIFLAGLHSLNLLSTTATFGLMQIYFYLYILLVMQGMQALPRGSREDTTTIRAYRSLLITTTVFNQSYGKYLVPIFKYLLSVFVTICLFGAMSPESPEARMDMDQSGSAARIAWRSTLVVMAVYLFTCVNVGDRKSVV